MSNGNVLNVYLQQHLAAGQLPLLEMDLAELLA